MTFNEYAIMYYTILRREMVRVLRIWPQTLLPSVITLSLYFLIFGKVVGSKIGLIGDVTYMQFITPGLIIMAVITNAYGNVVSSFFGARFSRAIEELLVSPANNHIVIIGYVSGGVLRGFTVGILVSIVAYLFGGFTPTVHSVPLILLGFIFCATLFSLGGLLNAIFSQKFDDTTIFPTFVLTPLIYLGGVFYTLNALPGVWQDIARMNPLFYIVDFVRYGFLGTSSVDPYIAFAAIIGFTFVLYAIVWYLLSRGIRLKA